MPGTLFWLKNSAAKASAHYLVTKRGELYQLVKDEDTAWHAGIVNKPNWSLYDGTNPNSYTLGIEHEALAGEALTEQQYQATLWLHRQLIGKWGIPLDRDHIIGHYRLDSVNRPNDPGPAFSWDRLFSDLSGTGQPTTVKIQIGSNVLEGMMIGNTSFAPVRALSEALGRQVKWWAEENLVVILPQVVGSQSAVNIAIVSTLIPAVMVGNKAYAPVRALAEALGRQVSWDGSSNIVIVM
jgi:N-acetyl-anhydromuramyl-L-alanine amidase AmpD